MPTQHYCTNSKKSNNATWFKFFNTKHQKRVSSLAWQARARLSASSRDTNFASDRGVPAATAAATAAEGGVVDSRDFGVPPPPSDSGLADMSFTSPKVCGAFVGVMVDVLLVLMLVLVLVLCCCF